LLIFSHRGNLNGKIPLKENTTIYLSEAIEHGFSVEFDINFNFEKTQLVLSHDGTDSDTLNDVDEFLSKVEDPQFHALNIKNPFTVLEILTRLKEKNVHENFFLFDFELLISDKKIAKYFMHVIGKQGFKVAYRLSEKEDYFEEYLVNKDVKILWMDEFEIPWIKEHHIKEFIQTNKQTIYVSPDLHGEDNFNLLKKRWEQIISYGVSGICTDFPEELKKHIGERL